MATIIWTNAKIHKPDSDQTVLCWGPDGFFCGYYDDSLKGWIGCESGGSISDSAVTHWSDPSGPDDEPENTPDPINIICQQEGQLIEQRKIIDAAKLAFGMLWMIEYHRDHELAAYKALSDVLTQEDKARGIEAAIDAGHEADHPAGCDWWAGKK